MFPHATQAPPKKGQVQLYSFSPTTLKDTSEGHYKCVESCFSLGKEMIKPVTICCFLRQMVWLYGRLPKKSVIKKLCPM